MTIHVLWSKLFHLWPILEESTQLEINMKNKTKGNRTVVKLGTGSVSRVYGVICNWSKDLLDYGEDRNFFTIKRFSAQDILGHIETKPILLIASLARETNNSVAFTWEGLELTRHYTAIQHDINCRLHAVTPLTTHPPSLLLI